MSPYSTLLAVMRSDASEAARSAGEASWPGRELKMVHHRGLAAVIETGTSTSAIGKLWARTDPEAKGRAARDLVARQRTFEAFARVGTVLPALPNQGVTPLCAEMALAGGYDGLRETLAELDGRVQYQITVEWAPDAVLTAFRDAPELAPIFADGAAIGAGALVSAVAALRGRLASAHVAALEAVVEDCVALPCTEEELLVNVVVLTRSDAVTALEAALEAIDETWSEGYTIRMIGPSPAVSFSAIALEPITRRDVLRAEMALDTPADADVSEITRQLAARVAGLQRADLDAAETDELEAQIVSARLLRRIATHRAVLGAAGFEVDPWDVPLLRLHREGEAEPRPLGTPRRRESAA